MTLDQIFFFLTNSLKAIRKILANLVRYQKKLYMPIKTQKQKKKSALGKKGGPASVKSKKLAKREEKKGGQNQSPLI